MRRISIPVLGLVGLCVVSLNFLVLMASYSRCHVHKNAEAEARDVPSNAMLNMTSWTKSRIPTFVIICGRGESDAVDEMQTLLKSVILLASEPVRVVLITDSEGAERIGRDVVPILKERRTPIRHVEIQTVSSFRDPEAYAEKVKLDLHKSHHSGGWGMLKLFLPWVLHQHDRFVVLDSDLIFLQDPILLWREFRKFDEELYGMPLHGFEGSHDMCSCVVLMRAEKIRESRVYPDLIREALDKSSVDYWHEGSGRYRPHRGDQGVYFQLFGRHRSLVLDLDGKWNRDKCHMYFDAFAQNKEAGILHKNCMDKRTPLGPGAPFFHFFERFRFSLLPRQDNNGDGERNFSFRIKNSTWLSVPK